MHIYGSAGGNMVPCCEAQETALNNPGETALESWNNENYKETYNKLISLLVGIGFFSYITVKKIFSNNN